MAKKTLKDKQAPKPAAPKAKASARLKKPANKASKPAAPKMDHANEWPKGPAKAPKNIATDAPTEAELRLVAGYPMLTKKDLAHYHRAPSDYVVFATNALKAWQQLGALFRLPGFSCDELAEVLAERTALATIERKLQTFYELAHYNRMRADGRAISLLLTLGRAVKGSRNQALASRFRELSEWIKATHSSGKKRAKKTAAAPDKPAELAAPPAKSKQS